MAVAGRYLFTQPESLLAIVAVVLIYFASHLDSSTFGDVLLRFVHLTAFSLYVGMSFWVTFIAGLSMYKILPRHLFAQVQAVLFSKFVAFCVIFSSLSLLTYYLQVKDQSEAILAKVAGLIVCVISAAISCLLIKPLTEAIAERNNVEVSERVGQGVGSDNEGCKKLLETNPAYSKLYYRVVWLHGGSAFVNLVSLVGIAIHLSTLSYNVTFH